MTSKQQKRNVLIVAAIVMLLFLGYVISQTMTFETTWMNWKTVCQMKYIRPRKKILHDLTLCGI